MICGMKWLKKSFYSKYGVSDDKSLEVFVQIGLSKAQACADGIQIFTPEQREEMENASTWGWREPTPEETERCFGIWKQPCPNDIHHRVFVRDFQG